jgi:hypothetical protein
MKEPVLDIARSIGDVLERRAFLGKAGALSLGAVLAAVGAPDAARAAAASDACPGLPPTTFSTLLGICTGGTGTTTYTPGITNTLQAIHNNDSVTFSPCTLAQNKVVTSMTDSFDFIGSCAGNTDIHGGGTILYSNGQTSTWTLDSCNGTRVIGQFVGVVSGLITNGPFNGARVWKFASRPVNDPSVCARASGVTSSTGTNTLIIAQ